MACCSCSATHANQDGSGEEEDIDFEKRSSNLPSIYATDRSYNEHRATLEDWSKQHEFSERTLVRKHENRLSARADLYQILGLFFVFQGVILTAVAQASVLTCHNWILPFSLSLLSSIAAFLACLQKLWEISEFTAQLRVERAVYKSLRNSIDALKEEGTSFDIRAGQPDLPPAYKESELSGKGSFDQLSSSIWRFCSMWIISYAGAVLLVLFLFSGITLFSIHQILCNPGEQNATGSSGGSGS